MTPAAYGNLPKLTVLMAVRNAEATIGAALDSIVLQHYPKLEVIVWDGLSTDGTPEVISRYGSLVTRLISEADNGPPDAHNRSLAHATGDFIAYLNADDTFEPGILWAVAEAALSQPDADVISTGMMHYALDRNGKKRAIGYYAAAEQLELTLKNVLSELPTFLLSRFYRKEFLEKAGPFGTDRSFCYIANDREWMVRLVMLSCRNAIVPHALYGFVIHDKSMSTSPGSFLAIIDEHIRLGTRLLSHPDMNASQRVIVEKWIVRQSGYGLIKSLLRFNIKAARGYLKEGMAITGWRFIPAVAGLLASRTLKKLGLMLSGGMQRC